jgi:hypothetical protein
MGQGRDEGCQIDDRLRATRLDTIRAMALGGLVTCAIFTTAARNIHGKGPDVKDPVETAQHLGAIFGCHHYFHLDSLLPESLAALQHHWLRPTQPAVVWVEAPK